MASTPSKPASLAALNFSMMLPPTPMVEYMMPLLRRFFDASAAKVGSPATTAAAEAVRRKSRRVVAISGELGDARHRDGRHRDRRIPIPKIRRIELLLGF